MTKTLWFMLPVYIVTLGSLPKKTPEDRHILLIFSSVLAKPNLSRFTHQAPGSDHNYKLKITYSRISQPTENVQVSLTNFLSVIFLVFCHTVQSQTDNNWHASDLLPTTLTVLIKDVDLLRFKSHFGFNSHYATGPEQKEHSVSTFYTGRMFAIILYSKAI